MDALVDLSWRAYPGGALMALGLGASLLGLLTLAGGLRRSDWDREKPVAFTSGLRLAIVGLAVAALGASWVWQQLWLLLLALAIGGEELLETSVILYTLRRGRRLEAQRSASR
jgi:multisubunit Na+/H+ antiporter MnhB subunit